MHNHLIHSELGKKSEYVTEYSPKLLFPVARSLNRKEINVDGLLPFYGHDVWNAYEISWLNPKGKPMVAIGEFVTPCTSPYLFESKSLKLYLNSFNNTRFNSIENVAKTIEKDLSNIAGEPVTVYLHRLSEPQAINTGNYSGKCLDSLDIIADEYTINPELLKTEKIEITESVYTNLLKSNCPITGQPDWASVQITYTGSKINPESLLKYIISFRNFNEFHEHCVERIFMDIMRLCNPSALTVEARFTRRGGIDINPLRSSTSNLPYHNKRHCRQ